MFISSPLKWRKITQPFGVNYVPFYGQFGLKGHNGIDWRAPVGTPCYACFGGTIRDCGTDNTGGIYIRLQSDYKTKQGYHYDAIYYHLSGLLFKRGDRVVEGEAIALTGNTGKYTTAPHLHFGLKKRKNRKVLNYDNGYRGCFDPQPYFNNQGVDGEWFPVDALYGQKRSWIKEWTMRFKIPYLHKYLKKIGRHPLKLTDREMKCLVYGYWSLKETMKPEMKPIVWTLTKPAFNNHEKPEIRL